MFLQALLERDEQVRKAREEALQSNRDLEAQLAAESSANQDMQVSAVCFFLKLQMSVVRAYNDIHKLSNEWGNRAENTAFEIHQQNSREKLSSSIRWEKWIVFMEMIKAHSCNYKSIDYHLYRKSWKERKKGKRNWNNKCQNFKRKSNTPRKLMGMLVFLFLYVILLHKPFRCTHIFRFSLEYSSERGKTLDKVYRPLVDRIP